MTQSAVWWSSVRLGGCLAQVFLCSCFVQNWSQVIKLTKWDDLGAFWTTLGHWQACHFWSQDVDADGIDKH